MTLNSMDQEVIIIGQSTRQRSLAVETRKEEAWGMLGFTVLRFWLNQLERLQPGAGRSVSLFPHKKNLLRGPLSTYTCYGPCWLGCSGGSTNYDLSPGWGPVLVTFAPLWATTNGEMILFGQDLEDALKVRRA